MEDTPYDQVVENTVLTLTNDGDTYTELLMEIKGFRKPVALTRTARWLKTYTHRIYRLCGNEKLLSVNQRHTVANRIVGEMSEFLLQPKKTFDDHAAEQKAVVNEIKKEINKMSNTPYSKNEYIFGTDIESLDNNELISMVAHLEGEIKTLGTIKSKAKGIDTKKADLQAALDRVLDQLNK